MSSTTKSTIVEDVAAVSSHTIDKTIQTIKQTIETNSKGFAASPVQITEHVKKATKIAENFVAFSKGNLEAFTEASKIYTAGLQALSKHIVAVNKASIDDTVAFTKSFIGLKSIKEATAMQSSFVRTVIDKALAESKAISEASVKLTKEAMTPLTARMTLAVETFGKVS